MKKLSKIKTYDTPSKEEVLKSIEKGAKSAADYLKGKIKLKNAKYLLKK